MFVGFIVVVCYDGNIGFFFLLSVRFTCTYLFVDICLALVIVGLLVCCACHYLLGLLLFVGLVFFDRFVASLLFSLSLCRLCSIYLYVDIQSLTVWPIKKNY